MLLISVVETISGVRVVVVRMNSPQEDSCSQQYKIRLRNLLLVVKFFLRRCCNREVVMLRASVSERY